MIKKIHATLEDFENYIRYDKKTHKCELLSFIQNPKISKTYFNKLSIFDKNTGTVPEDKAKIEEILKILKKPKKERNKEDTDKLNEMLNLEEKMGIGIMYGMAIGDAIGAVNEFEDVQYPHKGQENILEDINSEPGGHFMLKPGQWTDDTSMGLCIADSLIVNNGKALDPYDLMNRFVAWWRGGYNNAFRYDSKDRCSVGLGGNISMALFSYIDKPIDKTKQGDRNTSGNGSIMRNAAIPICFHKNLKEAQKNARIQSLTTHQGDEAKECCSLLTFIIIKIFERKMDKKEINNFEDGVILRDILTKIGKDFETEVNSVRLLANSQQDEKDDWNWKNEKFEYNPERQKKILVI